VKTAFLIGTLFLAGGIMYFSASTLSNLQQNQPTPTATVAPSITPTPQPSTTATPQPGTTTTPTPNPTQQTSHTPTPNPTQQTSPTPTLPVVASFSVFFTPSPAEKTSPVNMTISIVNPSSHTLQNAVIQGSSLFNYFTSTDSRVYGGTISLGQLQPGTSVFNLQLQPTKIGQVDDTLTLTYQNIQSPITQQISIRITGK
jgi:outer membrane biosynthesis protein TonB